MARMHAAENPNPGDGMEPGTTVEGVECPRCGDPQGQLPKHLPTCDGGGN